MGRLREPFGRVCAAHVVDLLDDSGSNEPCQLFQKGNAPTTLSVVIDKEAGAVGSVCLLLDVRPASDHSASRIMGAICCDPVMVRQDKWPTAVTLCRTRSDVSIVAYALDEGKELYDVASKLCNLGYPTVQILTGGLTAMAAQAPWLVDGPRAAELVASVADKLADPTRPPVHVLKRAAATSGAVPECSQRLDGASKSTPCAGQSFAGSGSGSATLHIGGRSTTGSGGPWRRLGADPFGADELRGSSQLVEVDAASTWGGRSVGGAASTTSRIPRRHGSSGDAVFRGTGTERDENVSPQLLNRGTRGTPITTTAGSGTSNLNASSGAKQAGYSFGSGSRFAAEPRL